ncbi:MAG: sigma-54-dependent Fis family transcriptional regulator [Kiritimatiellaeota bacterium]|nr:sigma-54-dependent Fis family transcriptional regulator [Kiritimatiellota bacterium]
MGNEKTTRGNNTQRNRILVVDDESGIRTVLTVILRQGGYEALSAANAEEALELLEQEPVDLVITDLAMGGGMDGLDLLRNVRARHDIPVVMITAFGTVKVAVEAMRLGAYDFIRKPLKMDDIFEVVRGALWHHSLGGKRPAADPVAPVCHFGLLVGESPPMQRIYRLIEQIADVDVAILIQGERGVGRSLTAKAIHCNSSRRDGPFLEVDCRDQTPSCLQQLLFDTETGSSADAFAKTRGGTLYIENVQCLPIDLQDRLTAVLGGTMEKHSGSPKTDAEPSGGRVIAGAVGSLGASVDAGTFSAKLYNILSTFALDLPPLRRRPEDVPLLALHFLARGELRPEDGRALRLDDRALHCIRRYSWPGNVTELRDALAAAAATADDGMIELNNLPGYIVRACHGTVVDVTAPAGVGAPGAHAREFLRQKQEVYRRILHQRTPPRRPPVPGPGDEKTN